MSKAAYSSCKIEIWNLNLYQQINVDVGGKGYEKRI